MDLARAMADYQLDQAKKKKEESEFKLVLVAPRSEQMPDDGFLQYVAAGDVKALVSAPDGGVMLFDEGDSRLLKMVVEYPTEFGLRIKVLDGLPDANYAPWFNSIVWSQDKVSYAGLLSELSVARSMHEDERERDMTAHDRERSQYERQDGSVRAQNNFRMADDSDDGGETGEEEVV